MAGLIDKLANDLDYLTPATLMNYNKSTVISVLVATLNFIISEDRDSCR